MIVDFKGLDDVGVLNIPINNCTPYSSSEEYVTD